MRLENATIIQGGLILSDATRDYWHRQLSDEGSSFVNLVKSVKPKQSMLTMMTIANR